MAVSVSVRWLTEQRQLGLEVLAGATGLDRRIEWAHSIELADPSPWLRGRELLLTTGLRLSPTDRDEHRGYVDRLDRAGVAALGFGIGLSHARVPGALVAAAESVGLPLLQVPLPTPFIAVIRAVTERIAQQQYEGVTRASRVQPRMTRAALRGGNRAVLRELAAATGGSVLQLGADRVAVAAYPVAASGLAAAVRADLHLNASPDGVPEAGVAEALSSSSSIGPDGVSTALRLQVGRRLHGFLVLLTPSSPTPIDHLLLGHAASLICLEQEKPLRLREAQNRFNEMVLGLLVDGTLGVRQAAAQLLIAGLRVDDGLIALAVGGADPRAALVAIDRALLDRDLPCVGAIHDGHAVVLLPAQPVTVTDGVLGEVAGTGSGRPTGVCRAGGPADVASAVRRSITAARVAALRNSDRVDAESMAGQALVAVPAARAVLVELAGQQLRPLLDLDRNGDADLLGTLRAFLEHHGHWEAASAALGLHRHTLHKRIDRIRASLGVDLDSAHVRAELLLYLTVLPLIPPPDGDRPATGSTL
jgi:purine catabolism regulator